MRADSTDDPTSADDRDESGYDFGWTPAWMRGYAIGTFAAFTAAGALQLVAPHWWPLAFVLLLLGASAFVGHQVLHSAANADYAVLPMVELLSSDEDLILDAGCGTGRTAIALGRVLRKGRIVAVDRFDARYIRGGGRELLERNLMRAGLSQRVTIASADLRELPFEEASFDSVVSSNVYDHLGRHQQQALREVFRVLKPGGRFLMIVWIPGWPMFAVANLWSLFLTSRQMWRSMADRTGFEIVDQGMLNAAWFVLLEKPMPAG